MELPDALAELKLVRNSDLPPGMEESDDEFTEEEDESMEVDQGEEDEVKPHIDFDSSSGPQYTYVRPPSPDFSWLPPLPGNSAPSGVLRQTLDPADTLPSNVHGGEAAAVPQDKLSLMDKYLTRQRFTSSSLASSNFIEPPPHPSPASIPPPSSSFPALLATYKAIAAEPSVSFAQTPLRMQAADLLRRVIAPPDIFGVSDTFSGSLPSPAGLIISASASDTLPPPTVQVNPNPTGILARLVREMRSPYLPPTLRDRLISLRPPLALNDEDGKPIYYGDPVRGPDAGMLNKARGKPPAGDGAEGDGKDQEAYYRYTWDVGPRGPEKYKGKLPSGKKVVKSAVGEDVPRGSEAEKKQGGVTGIKLRLDRSPSFVPPPAWPGGQAQAQGQGQGQGQGAEWEPSPDAGPSGAAATAEGGEKRPGSISLRIPSQTPPTMGRTDGLSPTPPISTPRIRLSPSFAGLPPRTDTPHSNPTHPASTPDTNHSRPSPASGSSARSIKITGWQPPPSSKVVVGWQPPPEGSVSGQLPEAGAAPPSVFAPPEGEGWSSAGPSAAAAPRAGGGIKIRFGGPKKKDTEAEK